MAKTKKAAEAALAPTRPDLGAATAGVTVPSWLEAAAEQVGGVFVLALVGSVIASGSGVFSLATWESAAAAAIAAGLKAIDALLGNAISVGQTSVVGAVRARRVA